MKTAPKKRMRLSLSDPKFRNLVSQVVVIVGIVVGHRVGGWFTTPPPTSRQRRIATGFGFLGRTAGIPIGEHVLSYDPGLSTPTATLS